MDQMLECPLTEMKARQEERQDAMEGSQEKNGGQPARDEGTIRACQEETKTVVNAIQSKLEATNNKRRRGHLGIC
jgi:hypothetical protein